MTHLKFTVLCYAAFTFLNASSAAAQNSHINQEGEIQMNDAAPNDDATKQGVIAVPDVPPLNDLKLFPDARSRNGVATDPSGRVRTR